METLEGKVQQILVEQLGVDEREVKPDASLGLDLGADSLDRVEIVMACEEEFGIEIPDADAEPVKTVGDLVRYLEGRLTAKKAGA
jgi:acyl carrier protein